MTIKMTFNQYMLRPQFSLETEDELRAAMLPAETEVKLRMRIWDLQEACLGIQLIGTPEQVAEFIQQQAFLKGKIEILTELLEASAEAKSRQSLAAG